MAIGALISLYYIAMTIALYFWSYSVSPVSVQGKHVIVTGGSSGVGLSTATKLASKGASVTIIARNQRKLDDALEIIEGAAVNDQQVISAISCDISDLKNTEVAIQKAAKLNHGEIHILINSAGITRPERFEEVDVKFFEHLMRVNYLGTVNVTRAVVPFMKEAMGGRIIYVSSLIGLNGWPGYSPYTSSKFAVNGLAQSLQMELSPFNINFSISSPSNIDTPMFVEEEKLKPIETRKLEESQRVISPSVVADEIIASLKDWSFIVKSDNPFTDPWLSGMMYGGFFAGSYLENLQRLFMMSAAYPWFMQQYSSDIHSIKKHRPVS
eukprot:TRINITY_DN4038_c0_g1_i1.p1 TRINITY_DN4038_c0_g1~~TRINITY_DN4038_c0_g1_i1.p1  ORF type:complete len:347 (-),score=101.87 TRINITY_DN4038_c0_g1_i1:110-1084(-)